MRALVLGSKGFAGSAFMRVFRSAGIDVTGISRDNYESCKGAEADVFVNADGNSAKYLAERDPVGELDRSVKPVLSSIVDFKFRTYVLLSSADVYPVQDDPSRNREDSEIDVARLSAYGLHKYLAENVVLNRCSKWLILRLGGLLGPGLRKNPVFDILTGAPLRVTPESRFGYIHTDEVAKIVSGLVEKDFTNDIINVCGKGLVSVGQLMTWSEKPDIVVVEDARTVHYEINNDRLAGMWRIPSTVDVTRDFMKKWRN